MAMPDLAATGPDDGARLGPSRLAAAAFTIRGNAEDVKAARWRLDGEDVADRVRIADDRATFRDSSLPEGGHRLTARVDSSFPGAERTIEWHFTVDLTPPEITVDRTSLRGRPLTPMRITGRTEDGVVVRADDRQTTSDNGKFALALTEPPGGPLRLAATDEAGNETTKTVNVFLVPRRPRAPIRSVHVTFHAWANGALRRGVLDLLEQGRINAVELDLKDESGIVGWNANVPFGRKIGAVQPIFDLRAAIRDLHARGALVIGRLVAFRDPIHAAAAWNRGWRNQVIQASGGGPYAGYGGFTNFADPTVRQYNIDVARAAAELGIDDVLYDYVRRPDGPLSTMVFPGLAETPERSVSTFLGEARRQLRPYKVFLGASVFGVAATRPLEIGQDISQIARQVDYVAPMLYPSHWGPGEYAVAHPNGQPYDIILRSLKDFRTKTRGTGARLVPWLQDFSLGVDYGAAEVAAQIRAARDAGVPEFLLWDPLVTYTADALTPAPRLPALPTRRPPTRGQVAAALKPPAGSAAAARVKANELGQVPVLMYHQIRADGGGDYDLTPKQFRAELDRLWREGYRPIRAIDLVRGTIDVPAGKSPVVLTFDDSTKEQFALGPDGNAKPNTAIAILQEFARTHRGFEPAGTFYPNREPFAGVAEGPEMLRWLNDNGFELGNHSHDHIPFNQLSATEVQRQLVLGAEVITKAVPGVSVRTMALPLGAMPEPGSLAARGRWGGRSYRHAGVFLVGAEPSRSPFSRRFDPLAVPRIRTSPAGDANGEFGSTYWLDQLRANPGSRYVSDGDPETIAFPRALAGSLADRFRARGRPY